MVVAPVVAGAVVEGCHAVAASACYVCDCESFSVVAVKVAEITHEGQVLKVRWSVDAKRAF